MVKIVKLFIDLRFSGTSILQKPKIKWLLTQAENNGWIMPAYGKLSSFRTLELPGPLNPSSGGTVVVT